MGYRLASSAKSGVRFAYGLRGCIPALSCPGNLIAKSLSRKATTSTTAEVVYLHSHSVAGGINISAGRSISSSSTTSTALLFTFLGLSQSPRASQTTAMTTPVSTTGAKPVSFTDYIWGKCKSQPLIPIGTSLLACIVS